jgi:hypothetical protein
LDTKEVKESTPKILKTRAEMRRRWWYESKHSY